MEGWNLAGSRRKRRCLQKPSPVQEALPSPQAVAEALPGEWREARIRLLKKADRLRFPRYLFGKYKIPSVRIQYGIDHPLGGTAGLNPFHKRRLKSLLHDCLFRHRWPEAAGILSVLLKGLCLERSWHPGSFRYYWAAMETIRQLEDLKGDSLRYRRIYHILYEKQPKSINTKEKGQAGAVRLELALYLLFQKQYEEALLASRPLMDVPPYRDHAVANMIHGLILHSIWYELIIQELKNLSGHIIDYNFQSLQMGLVQEDDHNEGVSSNFGFDALSQDESTMSWSEDFSVENFVQMDKNHFELKKQLNFVFKSDIINTHNDNGKCFSHGFSNTIEEKEKNYLYLAEVRCTADMNRRLFPVQLPTLYHNQVYKIPMGSTKVIGCHTNAVKHLKKALDESPHLTFALLPLVQLLLAVGDVEDAYRIIEKCCKTSDHAIPSRIKCLLLQSLEPRNLGMLIQCYEEILHRDPSSDQAMKSLIAMHEAGEYDTLSLMDFVAHHLDGSRGTSAVWQILASIFLLLKGALNNMDKDVEHQDLCTKIANEAFQYFLECNVRSMWRDRCTWWQGKHFNSINVDAEQQEDGGYARLAYKAACVAHMFGVNSDYLPEVKQRLNKHEKLLELLEEHTMQSLELALLLEIEENDRESTYKHVALISS